MPGIARVEVKFGGIEGERERDDGIETREDGSKGSRGSQSTKARSAVLLRPGRMVGGGCGRWWYTASKSGESRGPSKTAGREPSSRGTR